jgi:hypothetical protein
MYVAEIWRYPVKSMAGESIETAAVGEAGILGDRIVQVRGGKGRTVTARTRPRLLGHRATLRDDGEPLVDGRPWSSAEVARDVEAAGGSGAHLVRYEGRERFDILPLLVVTDGAIKALGQDRRRFRPNILIGGVPGLEERRWVGKQLRIGDAVIGVRDLRQRCIMTTFHPDTLEQDLTVLRRVQQEFDGYLGLNCYVARGGRISVGDEVELEDQNPPGGKSLGIRHPPDR